MELILTWGLGLSVLALLALAEILERPLRRFVRPDVRRDLTLADAVHPRVISVWLLANFWRVTRLAAFGILFGPPLILVLVWSTWGGGIAREMTGGLLAAAIHLALAIPPCAAMLLLLAKRACDGRRELSGGASIVAALVGAVTPFVPWAALTGLAQLLELGVSPLAPGGPEFFVSAAIFAFLGIASMALGVALQGWLAFGVYNAAERAFVRAYPWREECEPAETEKSAAPTSFLSEAQ